MLLYFSFLLSLFLFWLWFCSSLFLFWKYVNVFTVSEDPTQLSYFLTSMHLFLIGLYCHVQV